jgi:hypothetical protein
MNTTDTLIESEKEHKPRNDAPTPQIRDARKIVLFYDSVDDYIEGNVSKAACFETFDTTARDWSEVEMCEACKRPEVETDSNLGTRRNEDGVFWELLSFRVCGCGGGLHEQVWRRE